MNPVALYFDASFSFPDCDAIIVARIVLFQIHKAVLARHCPVLATRLERSVEFWHECPILRVSDTPYDIREMLRVAYDLSEDPSPPFPVLAAWLRVGTKYDIQALVDRATAPLQSLFPTKLWEWDERDGPEARHSFDPKDAIEALNLFQETRQYSMIPAAVYRCCQLKPAVVHNGTIRVDGTLECLSRETIKLLFYAKKRLTGYGTGMMEECRVKIRRTKGCLYKGTVYRGCRDRLFRLAHAVEEGMDAWRDGDPLSRRFLEYVDEQEDENDYECREDFASCTGICSSCIELVRETLDEIRAPTWNDLPSIAGVKDEIEDWGYDI